MQRWIYLTVIALLFILAGCTDNISTKMVSEQEDSSSIAEVEEEVEEQGPVETKHRPPLFDMEDGKLLVYGLTLGDSPATAEAIWGTPQIVEEEFAMDGETYFYYPETDMTIGYYEDKLLFISLNADEGDLQEVLDKFQGDHYQNPEGDTEFFFAPESGHLLIYGAANSVDGEAELRLLASDENFFYYVDEGFYVKVEE